MNYIVQIYQSIPPDVIALILGVIGASALQQKIKNWLELESPKVLVLLTTTFSIAAAVVPAALGYLGSNPGALGTHTAMFFTGMTLAYRYVIQPGSVKLNAFKTDREKYKAFKARQAANLDGVSTIPVMPVVGSADSTVIEPSDQNPVVPLVTAPQESTVFDG